LCSERRRCFPASGARSRIGDVAFRTVPYGDEAMPATVLARLLGNEEDDGSGVPRWVAGFAGLAYLPLASDLGCHLLDIAPTEIRKRDNRDFALRFRPDVFRNALDALNCLGLDYVRKVIYQPGRGRDLETLKQEDRSRAQNGDQHRRRWKPHQHRGKDLLSLDFMVWQEVYLADDSL
jgi:hypothetical protein